VLGFAVLGFAVLGFAVLGFAVLVFPVLDLLEGTLLGVMSFLPTLSALFVLALTELALIGLE
jgi:hypothetical protein